MRTVRLAVLVLATALAVIGIASCSTSEANGTVVRVTPREAVGLIEDGRHTVIDLRSPEAFAAGHVAGATNLDASAPDFEDQVAELDADVAYLVYARTDDVAAPAADTMVRLGVERVVDAGAFGLLAIAGAELAP
jgi:phage shock protein E